MMLSRNKRRRSLASFRSGVAAAALTIGMAGAAHAGTTSSTTPTPQDFVNAASSNSNWILTAKSYDNNRYVALNQITPSNVSHLKPVWTFHISDNGPMEATPIIWHGTAYITSAHDHVYAIDLKTGKLKWQFSDNPHVISFAANRGIALLDGNVYIGTLSGHLIALNAETGKKVFDVVAVKNTKNSFFTQAPIPYHNPMTGKTVLLENVSNGDWGGIGKITAFDPKTGKKLWSWNTIPGPGQKGHDTWSGDSWKKGGGSVWTPMALNPKTGMLYANVGNPSPDFNASIRKGKNLYTDSLVALNISGKKPKLAWYHQFTPGDTHDWDPVMPPVLFTTKYRGTEMPLVAAGDKGGHFYLLNAKTGKLVDRLAVSWQHGHDTHPTLKGTVACPATLGGIEFNGGSFDPKTDMFYVPSTNECGVFKSTKNVVYIAGQFYLGGAFPKLVGPASGDLNAISMKTGVFAWRHATKLPLAVGGALSTSSGLIFTGQLNNDFSAFDAKTGKKLWSYDTGSPITAPAVAFENDGTEYIAVASGPAGNSQIPQVAKANKGTMLTLFALSK